MLYRQRSILKTFSFFLNIIEHNLSLCTLSERSVECWPFETIERCVLVISMSCRTNRKPLEPLPMKKKSLKSLFSFIFPSQHLSRFTSPVSLIFCVASRDSEAFKAPSNILLYVLLKCSPQFYVWCIVVMTCVFCTARWYFFLPFCLARQKKVKTFSVWQRK